MRHKVHPLSLHACSNALLMILMDNLHAGGGGGYTSPCTPVMILIYVIISPKFENFGDIIYIFISY